MKRILCGLFLLLPVFARADLHPPAGGGTINTSSGTITQLFASSATIPHILGTTTNDNATVGTYGEYIESVISNTNYPATTLWGDATSIPLTAGDWDVTFVSHNDNGGATLTQWEVGISTTTGNSTIGLILGSNKLIYTIASSAVSISDVPFTIANYRISLATPTTIFAKFMATYSLSGPPILLGRLSARRAR